MCESDKCAVVSDKRAKVREGKRVLERESYFQQSINNTITLPGHTHTNKHTNTRAGNKRRTICTGARLDVVGHGAKEATSPLQWLKAGVLKQQFTLRGG